MILVICGPTGSGKSTLAIEIAKKVRGHIVNGDAFQIYREMNIGTAKPSEEDFNTVPHHLFNICSVNDSYSVFDYQKDVRKVIANLTSLNIPIIIVGGTGLYLKASLYDYEFKEQEIAYDEELDKLTNEELHKILTKLDEEESKKIHVNNRRRVIRAITIINNTGVKKSEMINKQKKEPIYEDVHFVGLNINRSKLYNRIDERVDLMMERGLEQEVRSLYESYGPDLTSFKAIGYKEFIPYFKGEITISEVVEKIKQNSRNYAKRQMTFFKNQLKVNWYSTIESAYEDIV